MGWNRSDRWRDLTRRPLPSMDLEHVFEFAAADLKAFDGARLFLTGGTGFTGRWLAESWCWARNHHGLRGELVVLSRNPEAWRGLFPSCPGFHFHQGDQVDFPYPEGPFDGAIHGALEQGASSLVFQNNVAGCDRVLAWSRHLALRRFLLLSSGAVYGPQPTNLDGIPESWPSHPESPGPLAGYRETKRAEEALCLNAPPGDATECVLARGFSFHGPALPLDRHFAVGDFLLDALDGDRIRILGDGSSVRSYLYGADMAIWLWAMFARGWRGQAYNLGSPVAISVRGLAEQVRLQVRPSLAVEVAEEAAGPPERYVPDVRRAKVELGLEVRISLEEGLRRTVKWLKSG